MVSMIKKLNPRIRGLLKKVSILADKSGYRVCLVGGFVRDILLQKENLDVDIVVEGSGIAFALCLAKELNADIITHKRFGTATITCPDGVKIDIATARKEVYLKPAQLPKVSIGTLKDDIKRRDFSINALAVGLNKENFGKIIDLFNGQEELKKGLVRILHDKSFLDDPTRILRGIRFQQRFGFKFSRYTNTLIREAKKLKMIEKVQKHRIRDELILTLKEKNPYKVLLKIDAVYNLTFIHKNITLNMQTRKLLRDAQEQIAWFKKVFPEKRDIDEWIIYLMILLPRLNTAALNKFCCDFAFRKGDRKRIVCYTKELHKLQKLLDRKSIKPSRVYRLLEPLSYETIIAILTTAKRKMMHKHIYDFFHSYDGVKLLISGEDLKKLGSRPGPHFKDVLNKVLHTKLDKKIVKKKDELKIAADHLRIKNK